MDAANLYRDAFVLHGVNAAGLRTGSADRNIGSDKIGFCEIGFLFTLIRNRHAGDHRVHLPVLQRRQQVIEFQIHKFHSAVAHLPGHALHKLDVKADKRFGRFLIIAKGRIIRIGTYAQHLFRGWLLRGRRVRFFRAAAGRNSKQANYC